MYFLFFCVNWDVICLQLIFESAYLICVRCSEWSSQFQVRKFWSWLRYLVLWWLVLVQRGNIKCSGDNTFCSQKISTILEGGIEDFDEANILLFFSLQFLGHTVVFWVYPWSEEEKAITIVLFQLYIVFYPFCRCETLMLFLLKTLGCLWNMPFNRRIIVINWLIQVIVVLADFFRGLFSFYSG